MGEFDADWLSLREPADTAARSASVTGALSDRFIGRESVRIVDLATGTGANLRYLGPRLPSPQHWLLLDRDVDLLAHVPRRVSSWALTTGCIVAGDPGGFVLRREGFECHVAWRQADLSLLDPALLAGRDLVTASALLDLVSERWLRALIVACAEVRVPVLFALSYDGRMICTPEDPDDGLVRDLVNRHQRRAKGFGRALGPDAVECAVSALHDAGYEWRRDSSDWILTAAHANLQRQLVEGWAAAASEIGRKQGERIAQWQARRLAFIEEGTAGVTVGHADLAAWPIA